MIGQTVSHYRILSKLGHGGMGVVYVAEDTHLGRRVAVKFSTASPENTQFRARFLREARAASALNHPHIASIYDYGETPDGHPFIVMELVSGEDLSHVLRRGALPVAQSLRIVEEAAEALGEAHRCGIAHRDIKPSNIVLSERGEVKVLDFGLAKQMQEAPPAQDASTILSSQTVEGTVLGTPQYMSPEQAKDAPLGPASDLFSLGAVLYECLAGRPAFSGANSVETLAAVLHVDPPPPSQFNLQATPEMDRITLKAMAKQPEMRYQSADEMAADLRAAGRPLGPALAQPESRQTQSSAVPTPPQQTAWSGSLKTLAGPLRRSRGTYVAALALLVAGTLVGWWLLLAGRYQPAPEALRWYQEGVTALRDGTYYKASKALERAASSDDRFLMAHARLAEAWLELDYADKAKEEMLRAAPPGASSRPARAEQLYLQAVHLTLTDDFAAAVEKYREIMGRTPADEKANAYVDLGRAYEKNENLKQAVECYQEATRRQPQYPAAWLRLAILYGRQMDQAKAAAAFGEAEPLYRSLSNLEGVTEVLYQRATLANRLGKFGEARAQLQQALEMSRSTGNLHQQIVALLQLSNVEHRANDAQAQNLAAEAIDLARANGLENLTTRGLIDLGNAYFVRGEDEEAKKYFAQALEYARRYKSQRSEARALLSLGSLELQQQETEGGLRDVEQALAWYQRGGYQKETAQALILMGRAQREKGDYPAALRSFQQQLEIARKLGDQTQVALSNQGLGTVLESQERWPDALAHYREAGDVARQSGDQLNVAYSLMDSSRVLWHLGRYGEAQQALEAMGPAVSPALRAQADAVRGWMALSQRQFAVALASGRRVLSQARVSSETAAEVRSMVGLALAGTGVRREAVASTGEAVALAMQSRQPWLMAQTGLAHAEALLAGGDARRALETALAAQQGSAGAGRQEAEWHCWLAASRAAAALGDGPKSREYAAQASNLLAVLEQKWDPDSYKRYLARPDIQYARSQLARLAGGR
ncbi:MAG: protein kinase [Bryobacteraceae bacterium]|jgi:serine/threonine protein kinase/Tfp pilus assembly protein PilF